MNSLKPLEQEYLIKQMIDQSMSGNEGLAIVAFRKKLGVIGVPVTDPLNRKLIDIELQARAAMETEIHSALCELSASEVYY